MNKQQTWIRLIEFGVVEGEMPEESWNLHEADLSEADLTGVDLFRANLSRAKLIEANLSRADLREADLFGANLIGADLSKADLTGALLTGALLFEANLSEAKLSKADLTGALLFEADLFGANLIEADLSKADLSKAGLGRTDLSKADLSEANLSKADMTESILIRADLTKAVLSGACIDKANLAGWVIKNIVCDHIVQVKSGKQIKIPFKTKEFETRYSQAVRIVELILSIPLTESAGFVANAIAQSVNHIKKSPVISWKASEALPDSHTRITFDVFDGDFYEKQKETFETILKTDLNDYFEKTQMQDASDHYLDPLEDTTDGLFKIKDLVRIPFVPLKTKTKTMEKKALEFFIKTRKTGEDIHRIVTSIFR
jgi:uncharacterized protein YjbI with pentapeptide repeats